MNGRLFAFDCAGLFLGSAFPHDRLITDVSNPMDQRAIG